jgi:hypothetical protein
MHLAVDRYLQGTLDERDQAAFEERLLWDQTLIDELDLAERLREGLRASSADDLYEIAAGTSGFRERFFRMWSMPQYAAAAAFFLGVGLASMFAMNLPAPDDSLSPRDMVEFRPERTFARVQHDPTRGVDRGGQEAITSIVPLLAVRGAAIQTIAVDERAWTVLLVDVPGDYDSYRITVREEGSGAELVWMQNDLVPTYPDALAVGMPGTSLRPGRYLLEVEGARDDATGARTYDHLQAFTFEAALAD